MKGKYLLPFLLVLLLCTGCGSKKLTCTLEEKESGMKMELVSKFKDDKVSSAKGEITIDAKKSFGENVTDDQMEELMDTLKESFKSELKADEIDASYKGSIVTIKFSKEASDDDETESYEEAKKTLEDQGYTCE